MTEAQLNWVEGLQFIGRAGKGPAIVMDNPEGGGGPTPMDLLLISVAGCTAMDVTSILKKKRSPFIGIQLNVSGERAEDHPKRYTAVTIEFVVTGHGVKPADVERAIELSATKYCGAIASINA
ncbi:MAG: OsmC family protein, partial [Desulfosarcinaceae bacterium]